MTCCYYYVYFSATFSVNSIESKEDGYVKLAANQKDLTYDLIMSFKEYIEKDIETGTLKSDRAVKYDEISVIIKNIIPIKE